MVIKQLLKQKKHLIKLIFEDETEVLLDNDICSEFCLKVGTVLNNEQLEELKYQSDYVRAKSRALWYLDRADRTEKGMYRKLVEAGFDKKASAAVIARFTELGLIDDVRFAENFAARCIDSNISQREAIRKMAEKGVPYDIAKSVFFDTEVDEEEQIKNVIEKKYLRKLETERGPEKVYAALVRKGFSFSAVRSVIEKYSEESEWEE